jgi:ABC-2 type transport system permease protein
VKPYFAILASRFQTLLQYRAAAAAGVGTQLFFGLVRVMVFDSFYRSSSGPHPMTPDQVTTYIWLGQGLLLLGMLDIDKDVAAMIRSGGVAYEMLRPVDLYNFWFARAVSGRAAPLALRALPIFLIAGLFLHLQGPPSANAAALFTLSIFGGLLLAASMVTLMTISLLWTISGDGIHRLAAPLIFFFSGIVIPLPMLPDWMQFFIAVLPFRGLLDTPFRLYMGVLTGTPAVLALLHQVVWLVALVAIGRAVLSRGLRRLVVQGG